MKILGFNVITSDAVPKDDIRMVPSITITDTYTREGKHVSSAAHTEEGKLLWEDGRNPSKDTTSFPGILRTPEPETEKYPLKGMPPWPGLGSPFFKERP